MSHDPVNHPDHYTSHPSGVECIDVVEHLPFNLGNAIKYLWRADSKGSPLEDLRKAEWYVRREIERRAKALPAFPAAKPTNYVAVPEEKVLARRASPAPPHKPEKKKKKHGGAEFARSTPPETVNEIRGLRAAGLPWNDVADRLNKRGVKSTFGKSFTGAGCRMIVVKARGRIPAAEPTPRPADKAKKPAPSPSPKAAKKASAPVAPKPTAPPVTLVKRKCSDCPVTFSGEAGARPPFRCPKCAAAAIVRLEHSDELEDLPLGARR